jgi:hypothetical protein
VKYRHLIDKPDYSDYASDQVLLWGGHPNSSSPIGRKASSTQAACAPEATRREWTMPVFGTRAGFARAFRREFIRQPL